MVKYNILPTRKKLIGVIPVETLLLITDKAIIAAREEQRSHRTTLALSSIN